MSEEKDRYFQVFNCSTGKWVKYDRERGRIVDCKKTDGRYAGIPVYHRKTEG